MSNDEFTGIYGGGLKEKVLYGTALSFDLDLRVVQDAVHERFECLFLLP